MMKVFHISKKLRDKLGDKKYFAIDDAAALFGISTQVLRYWEEEIAHLEPVRRRGGRRFYDHEQMGIIEFICRLRYQERVEIAGIQQRLFISTMARSL